MAVVVEHGVGKEVHRYRPGDGTHRTAQLALVGWKVRVVDHVTCAYTLQAPIAIGVVAVGVLHRPRRRFF
jgi:hypothetical protein